MREIEVKARVTDFEPIIKKLESLGCSLNQPIIQDDKVFVRNDVAFGDLTPGINVLRIRKQGEKNIFTLKIRGRLEMDCIERETEIEDPEKMAEILMHLDYREVVKIRKSRRKCKYQNLEICLDEVDVLGNFIEVEELAEEGDGEKIQDKLFDFLMTLGIKKEDRISSGYDILMFNKNNEK
jgi:adenylate cyclase class 2